MSVMGRVVVSLCLLFWSMAGTVAGELPGSVLDLLNRVPDPPSTAQAAVQWFDKDGRLIYPSVLTLKADIEQLRENSRRLAEATNGSQETTSLILGMDKVGFDAARLRTDPVYAEEVQKRLQGMSMEEKIALAQKISESQDSAHQTVMPLSGKESQAVRSALETAGKFPHRQAAWREGQRIELVKEFEKIPDTVPQKTSRKSKPQIEFDSLNCHPDCLNQWKTYGKDLWPLVLERETEILHKRRSLLQRYKTFLAEDFIQDGDKKLHAALYGELALDPENRKSLARYHQELLSEIQGLIELTVIAAQRPANVMYGGVEKFYGIQ